MGTGFLRCQVRCVCIAAALKIGAGHRQVIARGRWYTAAAAVYVMYIYKEKRGKFSLYKKTCRSSSSLYGRTRTNLKPAFRIKPVDISGKPCNVGGNR